MENSILQNTTNSITVKGYGASGDLIGGKKLKEMEIHRQPPKESEVLIEVLYCGVCHSDIHQVNNDWSNTIYPCVPGHEIVGTVTAIGSSVTKYKVGDTVGVGCMIDSCHECRQCKKGEEQFCEGPHGQTMTYNGYWKPEPGFNTFGGYSSHIVAHEDFVMIIPEGLDVSAAAPILCAGVTTYSPLKRAGIKAGHKVGVVGIGGLGHMAVMIAKAMGATVTAITTSPEKRTAAKGLGADDILVSTEKTEMEANEMKFDFIIVTIPDAFDINPYVCLLAARGSIVTVGLLGPYKEPTNNMEVAKLARTVGASMIGGTIETQEVLNFCAEHNIQPHVQLIDMEDINEAFEKIMDEEIRFRYVVDMKSLK